MQNFRYAGEYGIGAKGTYESLVKKQRDVFAGYEINQLKAAEKRKSEYDKYCFINETITSEPYFRTIRIHSDEEFEEYWSKYLMTYPEELCVLNAGGNKIPIYGKEDYQEYEDKDYPDTVTTNDYPDGDEGRELLLNDLVGHKVRVDKDTLSVVPTSTAERNNWAQLVLEAKTKNELDNLRARRDKECFTIINRGQLWYDTLSYTQKLELTEWYKAWLNVTDTKSIPAKPSWL